MHVLRFFLMPSSPTTRGCAPARRYIRVLTRSPRHLSAPPPTLRQLSAPPHTVSIDFSGAYSSTCCAPNRRSNPIAHRVRRKRQRLPPSLLIENASERLPLPTRNVMPRRFRSRLATTLELRTRPTRWALPRNLAGLPQPRPESYKISWHLSSFL
jgi:hypothetical protein